MSRYEDENRRGSSSRGSYYQESNLNNSRSRSISHSTSSNRRTRQSSSNRNEKEIQLLRLEKSVPNLKLKKESIESVIMKRMKSDKSGWLGTCSSNSSESLSEDSGYGESSESYLNEIKKGITKAIWGEMEPSSSLSSVGGGEIEFVPSQGAQLWNKLITSTTILSSNFSNFSQEDDDKLDNDGNTKLIRVMKEYHFSKVTSSSDLPRWLFSNLELVTTKKPSTNRINSDQISRSNYSQQVQYQSETKLDRNEKERKLIGGEERRVTPKRNQTMRESERKEFISSGSGSRTTDQLRAMKAEKLERATSCHNSSRRD